MHAFNCEKRRIRESRKSITNKSCNRNNTYEKKKGKKYFIMNSFLFLNKSTD